MGTDKTERCNELALYKYCSSPNMLNESNEIVIGKCLIYNILATNTLDRTLFNVTIKEPLSPYLKFVEGSITVNSNVILSGDITQGLSFNKFEPGQIYKISYKVRVVAPPVNSMISSKALAVYRYNSDKYVENCFVESNVEDIRVLNPSLKLEQYVDKPRVSIDEDLTYEIILSNNGDVDLTNIILIDELGDEVDLILNSVTFDSKGMNLTKDDFRNGIVIEILPKGKSLVIDYMVRVKASNRLRKIVNCCYAKYEFISITGESECKTTECITGEIDINMYTCRQFSIKNCFTLPDHMMDLEYINNVLPRTEILDYEVYQKMYNGKYIDEYFICVKGVVNYIVEYTSTCENRGIFAGYFKGYFSETFDLPKGFCWDCKVYVDGTDELDRYDSLHCRSVSINSIILIMVKVLCAN
ncbi:MAG: DUF11 domain-containing protein [Clostridium sp.]